MERQHTTRVVRDTEQKHRVQHQQGTRDNPPEAIGVRSTNKRGRRQGRAGEAEGADGGT